MAFHIPGLDRPFPAYEETNLTRTVDVIGDHRSRQTIKL